MSWSVMTATLGVCPLPTILLRSGVDEPLALLERRPAGAGGAACRDEIDHFCPCDRISLIAAVRSD